MTRNIHVAQFNFVQPGATVRVVSVTATANTWASFTIPTTPPEPDRFMFQLEAVDEAYELRFHASDSVGIRIPANVQYIHPFALGRDVVPAIKKATAEDVRGLVSFPGMP